MSDVTITLRDVASEAELDRQLGDFGKTVPARQLGRKAQHAEAHQLRQFLIRKVTSGEPITHLLITHRATGQSLPDFQLKAGNDVYWIECTEVCPPEDGSEIAIGAASGQPRFNGDHGGQGADGFTHRQARVTELIDAAIRKKEAKRYDVTDPVDLLLYLNANATFGIGDDARRKMSQSEFRWNGLRYIYCIWRDQLANSGQFITSLRRAAEPVT